MGKMMKTEPKKLPIKNELPDIFTFEDKRKVTDEAKWWERASEIKEMYEYYMYGPLPSVEGEVVSCRLYGHREIDEEKRGFDGSTICAKARVCDMEVTVAYENRECSYHCIVTLPLQKPQGAGYPVYIEMSFVFGEMKFEPSLNAYYAAKRGYATINWLPSEVAADNGSRTGAFYMVHPYGENWLEQTGVLSAWGWGASKILDVLEQGKAEALQIDWKNNILSGVSRYGKATLVAGAYDERFRVVVPACSGAGGVAMYRYKSEGTVYDLAELNYQNEDGTSFHETTQNEPLESLQSSDERHWFNDIFLEFDCEERFPVDQHQLAALVAHKDRYLFIIASALGEDWTNPAAMYETYSEVKKVYQFLKLEDHLCINVHLQGHAVLLDDMYKLLDYCDVKLLGRKWSEVETKEENLHRDAYFPKIMKEK